MYIYSGQDDNTVKPMNQRMQEKFYQHYGASVEFDSASGGHHYSDDAVSKLVSKITGKNGSSKDPNW